MSESELCNLDAEADQKKINDNEDKTEKSDVSHDIPLADVRSRREDAAEEIDQNSRIQVNDGDGETKPLSISNQIDKHDTQLINKRQIKFNSKILNEAAAQLLAIWIPVTAAIVVTCTMTAIHLACLPSRDWISSKSIVKYYSSHKTTADSIFRTIIFVAIAIVGIVIMSFTCLCLMQHSKFFCIRLYIFFTFIMVSLQFIAFWLHVACSLAGIWIDWITFTFVVYNVVGLVFVNLFRSNWCPKRLQQLQTICASAMAGYVIMMITLKSSIVFVFALCTILSIWDLIAVLSPKGPLREMVKLAQSDKRGKVEASLRPLLYSAALWRSRSGDWIDNRSNAAADDEGWSKEQENDNEQDEQQNKQKQEHQSEQEHTKDVRKRMPGGKLGMGDFVFYSFLTASAFAHLGLAAAITCYVALFVGFCITSILLVQVKTALPALPFPMLFAVLSLLIFYAQNQNQQLRRLGFHRVFY